MDKTLLLPLVFIAGGLIGYFFAHMQKKSAPSTKRGGGTGEENARSVPPRGGGTGEEN